MALMSWIGIQVRQPSDDGGRGALFPLVGWESLDELAETGGPFQVANQGNHRATQLEHRHRGIEILLNHQSGLVRVLVAVSAGVNGTRASMPLMVDSAAAACRGLLADKRGFKRSERAGRPPRHS